MVEHLTPEAMKLLLEQPNKNCLKGRRNLTLMSVLYDTGARVQELIDITVRDVILEAPAVIVLNGKGNKIRRVPLMKNTVSLLEHYIVEHQLDKPWKNEYPLFSNSQHNKLCLYYFKICGRSTKDFYDYTYKSKTTYVSPLESYAFTASWRQLNIHS